MELNSLPILAAVVMLLVDVVLGQQVGRRAEGHWTDWTSWSGCSESCESGIKRRTKYWEEPPGEKKFDEPWTITENSGCNEARCPIDGSWGMWAQWSPCTEACGGGISKQERTCSTPRNGGKKCEGENYEEEQCNRVPCPPLPQWFNLSICTKDHFMCTGGKMCIPIVELCDDTVQCYDGSDEKRCYKVNDGGPGIYSYVNDKGSHFEASLLLTVGLIALVIMCLVG